MEENLGGNTTEIILAESPLSCHLTHHLVLDQGGTLDLLVLGLQLVGKHDQTNVATLFLSRLFNGMLYHLNPFAVVILSRLDLHTLELDSQIAGSRVESLEELVGVLSTEGDDGAAYAMFVGEDRLVEEVEESLLAFLHCLVLPEGEAGHGNDPSLHGFEMFVDLDS